MQVACQCGQPFTIEAGSFPRTINCHACGHRSTVLDTGETIELRGDKRSSREMAISDTPLPPHSTPSSAICTEDNIGEFASAAFAEEERSWFEKQWQKVCKQHTIGTLLPTRRKGVIVAVGFGVTFLVMMAIEAAWFFHFGNPVLIAGAVIALATGSWLYRRGSRFESAKAEWELKRLALHAKYHLPISVVPGMTSIGSLWLWSLPGILIASGLLFAFALVFSGTGMFWVGSRDLEITFVITDADTGKPIAGSVIEIADAKSNWCDGCDGPIGLIANQEGEARQLCRTCMCFGYSGWSPFFRWSDTFGTHHPSWPFEASAPGYQRSGRLTLHRKEFRRTIQRGDAVATMRVEFKLHRRVDAK